MSDHETTEHEPADSDAAHEGQAHGEEHGHAHHGGHEEEHGQSHGGNWVITYCDMVTLLIACFIAIITFSSSEQDKHKKKRDSLVYGTGGTGIAGDQIRKLENDGVVIRQLPLAGHFSGPGAEMPPGFNDPDFASVSWGMRQLQKAPLGTLSDTYQTHIPLRLLFDAEGKLTSSGEEILKIIAGNMRHLPYDLHLQADDPADLPRLAYMAGHFGQREAIHPSRIGIGIREPGGTASNSVAIVFFRQN